MQKQLLSLCLAASLLSACSAPSGPTPAATAPAPTATATSASEPKAQNELVGRWKLTGEGVPEAYLEFTAHGYVASSTNEGGDPENPRIGSLAGTYKAETPGQVELSLDGKEKEKATYTVAADELTLKHADGTEKHFKKMEPSGAGVPEVVGVWEASGEHAGEGMMEFTERGTAIFRGLQEGQTGDNFLATYSGTPEALTVVAPGQEAATVKVKTEADKLTFFDEDGTTVRATFKRTR